MGTSFPTPYEAVVDKTKGLSVRSSAVSKRIAHSCRSNRCNQGLELKY